MKLTEKKLKLEEAILELVKYGLKSKHYDSLSEGLEDGRKTAKQLARTGLMISRINLVMKWKSEGSEGLSSSELERVQYFFAW